MSIRSNKDVKRESSNQKIAESILNEQQLSSTFENNDLLNTQGYIQNVAAIDLQQLKERLENFNNEIKVQIIDDDLGIKVSYNDKLFVGINIGYDIIDIDYIKNQFNPYHHNANPIANIISKII